MVSASPYQQLGVLAYLDAHWKKTLGREGAANLARASSLIGTGCLCVTFENVRLSASI